MIQKAALFAGIICLFFAAIPLIFYGIFNTGTATLWLLGLALVFMPRYWGRLTAIRHMRLLIPAAIILGAAYCIIVSGLMINRAYFNKPPENGEIAVIVLGSGIKGDKPSLMLQRRLNEAFWYMRSNPEAYCIVSGGQGPDEIMPESTVMKNYLLSLGVSPELVTVEDKSSNTRENLKFSAELIPDKNTPAVIATDEFHQLRAGMYARNAGLENTYALSSLSPWGLLPSYWAREMFAIAAAWLLTIKP